MSVGSANMTRGLQKGDLTSSGVAHEQMRHRSVAVCSVTVVMLDGILYEWAAGIVLDQISVVTELRQAGARASRKKLSTTGAAGGGGGAGGGIDNGDGAGGVVGYGAVYEMGRAMVVMAAGAVGLRAFNCQVRPDTRVLHGVF